MTLYAGVEAGGSKFVCEVAASPTSKPKATLRVETTTPDETLGKVEAFLGRHRPEAIGIASFGPVDLHRVETFRLHHQHSEGGLGQH